MFKITLAFSASALFLLSLSVQLSPTASAAEATDSSIFSLSKTGANAMINGMTKLRAAYNSVQGDATVRSFLSNNKTHSLSMDRYLDSPELQTTKFQHYFKGVEVIGSETQYHLTADHSDVLTLMAKFDLDTTPAFDAETAIELAKTTTGLERDIKAVPTLKILPNQDSDSARLIYIVEIMPTEVESGRDVFIDAHSGEVLADISHHMEIAPIQVHTAKDQFISIDKVSASLGILPAGADKACQVLIDAPSEPEDGMPVMVKATNCKQVVKAGIASAEADTTARRALNNSRSVLSYYETKHSRNSYDGRGSAVTSVVHVGKKFSNAFWSSDLKIMAYGDGDGVDYADFTNGLDVAGHEMTHGVTSETAKLVYMGESGALNEAYSDIFGLMISNSKDWILGKGLFVNKGPKSAIRNIATPGALMAKTREDKTLKPYPAKISERFTTKNACTKQNDNCFVHINSTIVSHAAYLVEKSIGRAKMEKLYYLTLTHYLNANANFAKAAELTLTACATLYDSDTCSKVKTAFAGVGF